MNRLTIVCGIKWNWPASFTMWNTIRSAPVWYRIQPIGLGRAHGWQAKAPAPQLPQTLAKCRNSRDRPGGLSYFLAPGKVRMTVLPSLSNTMAGDAALAGAAGLTATAGGLENTGAVRTGGIPAIACVATPVCICMAFS